MSIEQARWLGHKCGLDKGAPLSAGTQTRCALSEGLADFTLSTLSTSCNYETANQLLFNSVLLLDNILLCYNDQHASIREPY